MSAQELDLKRSWGIVRRHRRLIAAFVALGLVAGIAVGLAFPPMFTGKALVILPPPARPENGETTTAQDIETQVLIATSAPVIASAAQNMATPMDTTVIKSRVTATAVTQDILQIRAEGTTARQANEIANSVADTYVFYVTDPDAKLPRDLGKLTGARVLEHASDRGGGIPVVHLALLALLGGLAVGAGGSVAILAVARGDRRLRLRDEIADAVGIPVLASLASHRPADTAGWAQLLEKYEPTAVDAWSLRKTLHHLGLDARGEGPVSLCVISFAKDPDALPIGPQLAAFASSIGIASGVVVDTHHESAASLIACEEGFRRRLSGNPTRSSDAGGTPTVTLRVFVIVVDRDSPQLREAHHAARTVVAVSAGAVTAEDLARLAVAAADDTRTIDGIVVADPDPADRSTGRVPQGVHRASSRAPSPLASTARRTRR